jgi:predicted nucleic acid-binding protein
VWCKNFRSWFDKLTTNGELYRHIAMSWLLDTCALSEYVRKAPAPAVIRWLDEQDESSLFISVINLGEIEKGILKLRASDPRRSQKLTAWLGKVEQRFAGRILALDTAALHVWAQIAATAELAGQPLPVMDGLLMATAQCHGLTVVTRNVQDFTLYLQVFNPWAL